MINITKTYLPDKKKYFKYIDQIHKNGWITNQGTLLKEVPTRLESYLDVKNLVLVANGTVVSEIVYVCRALKKFCSVIMTPFSFVAPTRSLVTNNLNLIFCNIKSAHKICPRQYFYPSLNMLSYIKNKFCPISKNIVSQIIITDTAKETI